MNKEVFTANITKDSYVNNANQWETVYYVDALNGKDFDDIQEKFAGKRVKITIEEVEEKVEPKEPDTSKELFEVWVCIRMGGKALSDLHENEQEHLRKIFEFEAIKGMPLYHQAVTAKGLYDAKHGNK